MISSAQAVALKTFLDAALVGTLTTEQIYRTHGDLPETDDPFLTYNFLFNDSMGVPSEIPEFPGAGPAQLVVRDMQEQAIEFQVGMTQGDTPTADEEAGRVLVALKQALYSSVKTFALRAKGLARLRVGQIVDLTAIASGSQWETRASLTVVFARTEVSIDIATSTIESVETEGTLSPVPGTVGPEVIGP